MVAREASPSDEVEQFKVCSVCRKPIGFGERYYRCSVSTCNRSRTALFFCSLPCWDAHLPEQRHRDAWAEQDRAPSKDQWEAEQRAASEASESTMSEQSPRERKIVTPKSDGEPNEEILIVVSKLKAYVKGRSGFSTSDAVMEVLSTHLRRLCDRAIDNASLAGRKTVLDRDFRPLLKVEP